MDGRVSSGPLVRCSIMFSSTVQEIGKKCPGNGGLCGVQDVVGSRRIHQSGSLTNNGSVGPSVGPQSADVTKLKRRYDFITTFQSIIDTFLLLYICIRTRGSIYVLGRVVRR